MFSPQHGKVIVIESYYEGALASTKQEYEVSIFSTKESILRDVIDALGLISDGSTKKLDLCIQIDVQGRYRMIKRWVA